MKKAAVVVTALAALFLGPALALAAGIPGATVTLVCNDIDLVDPDLCADPALDIPEPVVTDSEGGFVFENLAAVPWLLKVEVMDSATPPAVVKSAQIDFVVTADQAPARLAGTVTALAAPAISLEVNAGINEPDTAGIVLLPGYPKLQPAWNRNWVRANGQLHVRLAGTGLEGLEKVVLTSDKGSVETTVIMQDPESGEYHAIFRKRAAFAALVPDDAVRGDVVPITVSLTNALGTDEFDASFRIVGPKKPRRH